MTRQTPEFEMIPHRLLCVFVILAGASTSAIAQDDAHPALLDQIKKRGAVSCGVTADQQGFSTQDSGGPWRGFDVDICRALAAAIFDDPEKILVSAIAPKERTPALQSGAVDVLAGGAPWTQSRDASQRLLYTAIAFFDGQGLLARNQLPLTSARDLSKVSVCVQQGTSFELDLPDFFRAHKIDYEPRLFPTLDEAAKAYDAGQCDSLSAETSTLYVLRTKMTTPADHSVLAEFVTKSPHGPIVRQGDDQWFNIVRWTLFAMLDAEELGVASDNADQALKSENPETRRLLGVDGDLGDGLGLSADWVYRVVKHVGNYGEVFERNLGQNSLLQMERRQNALWSKGGLLYAPPVR